MKGRKAIPTKILNLRGGTTITHRPPRVQEPEPPEKMPACPEHLDEMAKKEWERAGKILQSIGLMTELDMAVFAGYCDGFSQWVQATLKVREKGMVGQKPDGLPFLNPYLRIARDAFEQMMKAAVLLGLSPANRVNLKVNKPKPMNKEQEFRTRKRKIN